MKQITFLAIALMVFSCGSDDPQKPIVYQIEAQFQDHVNSFYAETSARGHGTIVQENLIVQQLVPGYKDDNGVFAVSRYYKKGKQRIIEVSDLDPSGCEELPIFRELAHVFLNKSYVTSGEVVMNPYADPCGYIHIPTGGVKPNREDYMVQLFGQ